MASHTATLLGMKKSLDLLPIISFDKANIIKKSRLMSRKLEKSRGLIGLWQMLRRIYLDFGE
jgi:hypothetical protein